MKEFKVSLIKTFYVSALNQEDAIDTAEETVSYEMASEPKHFFDTIEVEEIGDDDIVE